MSEFQWSGVELSTVQPNSSNNNDQNNDENQFDNVSGIMTEFEKNKDCVVAIKNKLLNLEKYFIDNDDDEKKTLKILSYLSLSELIISGAMDAQLDNVNIDAADDFKTGIACLDQFENIFYDELVTDPNFIDIIIFKAVTPNTDTTEDAKDTITNTVQSLIRNKSLPMQKLIGKPLEKMSYLYYIETSEQLNIILRGTMIDLIVYSRDMFQKLKKRTLEQHPLDASLNTFSLLQRNWKTGMDKKMNMQWETMKNLFDFGIRDRHAKKEIIKFWKKKMKMDSLLSDIMTIGELPELKICITVN